MIEIIAGALFAIMISFVIVGFWFSAVFDNYLPLIIKICFTITFICMALLSWLPLLSCFVED